MSAVGVLQLLMALAQDPVRHSGGQLQIVPVVDSELPANHELYDAALRRINGVYIATDRLSEPSVPGVLDLRLSGTVTGALNASALSLDIRVIERDSNVLVTRADDVVPQDGSELVVLKFAAALFHAQLREHEVAAISWTEDRLDEVTQLTLWELIRVHIPPLGIGSLRTLILIAGGYIKPDVHCEGEPSIRYALTESGLSKRKGVTSLRTAVGRLSRNTGQLFVIFLGAGASSSARMPLGNSVRDYALESFFADSSGAPVAELAFRFHRWVQENDRLLAGEERMDPAIFVERLTLERVLREEFRREGRMRSPTLKHLAAQNANAVARKMTRTRRSLATILAQPHKLVLVTVNFDTILEDEFDDRIRVFASSVDFAEARKGLTKYLTGRENRVPVLKLHGTLFDPTTIVADVDTRSLGLPPGAAEALQLLRQPGDDPIPWVYIGASMRDPDVTEVIGGSDFADGTDEWWVSPLPDPAVSLFADEHRIARWQNRERPGLWERQITETADKFLADLAAAWPSRL
jgi:hypothetical protein